MAKKKKTPTTRQQARRHDCVAALANDPQQFNLAINDPPYNFGMSYDSYDDKKSRGEYLAWTRDWLAAVTGRLHKHGSLFVFVPDDWVSRIDVMAQDEFGYHKRNHIVWAFTFGQKAQKRFTRSHTHVLYFSRIKTQFTFNTDAVKVPSARELVYKDKRAVAGGKPPDATWLLLKDQLEPYMTPDTDTWLQSRVCGTYKERQKHIPNQIPVPLMTRIVLACSNPGDWVLDPFCGSGSSGLACKAHGRNWTGYDVSATAVAESNKRIAAG